MYPHGCHQFACYLQDRADLGSVSGVLLRKSYPVDEVADD